MGRSRRETNPQLRACEQKLADTLWMSAKQAIEDGQCLSAIDLLQKYLAADQAEYRPDAQKLLEEAKLAISEPLAAQKVATWSDRTAGWPTHRGAASRVDIHPIRSQQLLVVYERVLREQAQLERPRRRRARTTKTGRCGKRTSRPREKERFAREAAEKKTGTPKKKHGRLPGDLTSNAKWGCG